MIKSQDDFMQASATERLRYALEKGDIDQHAGPDLLELFAELEQARAENARLREALEYIESWSQAYPIDIFPEPDLKHARALLESGGITLDAVSAHAMRYVITGVGDIARAALAGKDADAK